MQAHEENPAPRVERVFKRIAATRMAGLPLNNPALAVEACGFSPWQGLWLGVLVTPWAINLMLLPGGNPAFRRLGADEKQRWAFPSGEYEFLGGEEAELGAWQSCSLFSPAFEFAGPDEARAAARAALEALLAPGDGEAPVQPGLSRRAFFGSFLPQAGKA